MTTDGKRSMSAFAARPKSLEIKGISASGLGQNCPRQYPHLPMSPGPTGGSHWEAVLGDPLSIREVARLLGCSPWTVRQQHIPRGLPHFRSGPNGKLVFFRDQVITWILNQQKKGGCQ